MHRRLPFPIPAMKPLLWDAINPFTGQPFTWGDPNLRWGDPSYYLEPGDPGFQPYGPPKVSPPKKRSKPKTPPPTNLPAMSDSFQYITRPTSDGNATTTQPVYRGTKSQTDIVNEVQARMGATPLTIDEVICTFMETVIDWTTQGWKVAPCHDLVGFQLTTGGSSPIGGAEDWNFDTMKADLNCQWGDVGEARSRALFTAEKVGEQSRAAPVWVEVYDSETKLPNHYQVGKGLSTRFSNNKFEFLPASGCKIRFRKADNTFVDAAGYPYIKGKTVVCTPPAGLAGTVNVEITALINGSLRTSEYPFPLT